MDPLRAPCGPKLGPKIQKYGKSEYIFYLTVKSIEFRANNCTGTADTAAPWPSY